MEQTDRSRGGGCVGGTAVDQPENIYAYMHSPWSQTAMW